MDISTAGALSLYNYQSTLQSAQASGASAATAQSTAVAQALDTAYSNATSYSSGDPLADMAGTAGLASLASGIYSASGATGGTANPTLSLTAAMTTAVGSTNAATASGLLSGLDTGGLQGISAQALDLNTTLAMTAYTVTQDGLPAGNLTQAATSLAASIDPTQPSSVQSAIQAATAGSNSNTVNLLA
jgi:hypothetical protein